MKPKKIRLPVVATFVRPNGKDKEMKLDLINANDIVTLRDQAKQFYFSKIEFPEGSLSEILSYFSTGDNIREKPAYVPLPAPSGDSKWIPVKSLPSMSELKETFPGMDISQIAIYRSDPPKKTKGRRKAVGIHQNIAPHGYEVSVMREYWPDAAQTFDRIRIRTRQKNRPIPVRIIRSIAQEFFGDRVFWFDLERTNTTDHQSEDFHRYHFLSIASSKHDLVSLLRNGSVFVDLLRTLATKRGKSASFLSPQKPIK